MSFWDDVFTWNKPKKQTVDLNVNTHNSAWLLNEELKRMHNLMLNPKMHSDSNVQLMWKKIQELQKKMCEMVDKTPDIDTQKAISDIQNRIIEETVLGKEQK